MAVLTKQQIFDADDCLMEELDIPEWGGSVFVKVMKSAERDHLEALAQKDELSGFRARLAVLTCCDSEGNMLFTKNDIEELGNRSAAVLSRIAEVATRINGWNKKDVDTLEKNS